MLDDFMISILSFFFFFLDPILNSHHVQSLLLSYSAVCDVTMAENLVKFYNTHFVSPKPFCILSSGLSEMP